MLPPGLTTAGLGLLAALSWGGGDFSGGMGVKAAGGSTTGALRVIIAAHSLSLVVLVAVLAARHATLPTGTPLWWGLGAGVAAGLSLTAFYIALARGAMGASAAISGLLAAAIPAAVSSFIEGTPSVLRLAGFLLAGAAIWLVAVAPAQPANPKSPADPAEPTKPETARPLTPAPTRSIFALAVGGGIGFGIYFASLRFANPLGLLEPMALARTGSLATCLVLLLFLGNSNRNSQRGPWLNRTGWLWVLGVAVLDTGGNLLFIAATRTGRLDVAAVLASLYPASTILLAAWLLHERLSRQQWIGMAVALGAVVMITV